MTILGIETSCDETGAAILQVNQSQHPILLSNRIATSLSLHAETGGIIPEIAAREQIKYCLPVIDVALNEAKMRIEAVDAIAVTYGPGLIGSLLVGVETAKTLSYVYNKPLIPVNHLYGHLYVNWIGREKNDIQFPAIALVVSGGHTDLVLIKGHGDVTVIGGTRDDAAGEAFDKIGRLLQLPYPAGPVISKLAISGDSKAFSLPRPMIGSNDYDFSFSGLKTSVLNLIKRNEWDFTSNRFREENQQLLKNLCASVEEAIIDILIRKTLKAAKEYEVKSILLGGGVAANSKLQESIRERAKNQEGIADIFIPDKSLCTDNAGMIAAAAYFHQNITPWQDVTANPELYF